MFKKKKITLVVLLILVISLGAGGSYMLYQNKVAYHPPTASAKKQSEAIKETQKAIDEKVLPEKQLHSKVGILRIPSLQLEIALTYGLSVDGAKTNDATNAPLIDNRGAIVAGSNLPGEHSQVYVSGHNNQAFSVLQNIKEGAEITIQTSEQTYKYLYKESKVVDQTQVDVINNRLDKEELILQTCYPFDGTDTAKRILFYAYPKDRT